MEFEEDEDGEHDVEKSYVLNDTRAVKDYLTYLRGLVLPLVEAYAITAFTLDKLVGRQLLENEFLQLTLNEMKLLLNAKESKHCVYNGMNLELLDLS